jgi:DivIVA domain-containing protein
MTEVLTAADVREAMFSKPQIGKRGYHENDVDALLDGVAATLDALAKR